MQTTPKANKTVRQFFALLAGGATLAIATLVIASTSKQVENLSSLVVPRTGHAATALSDGKVLITGGHDSAGNLVAVSEIFDPTTKTSTASATLTAARVNHTATRLADGRVLVAGGTGASGALSSAEIFDPANPSTGFQTVGSAMTAARSGHTATLLNNGSVLIAGGEATGTAEIFDPATQTFSPTLWNLIVARSGHTATLFTDDSVLLAGGNADSLELFTPADQKFTVDTATMSAVRTGHWAFELSDTRLLLFQGDTGNTIDEYNPTTDTITPKGSLNFHASSSSLLANGKILVLGTGVAGLYDPDAVPPAPDFTAFDETSVPGSGVLPRSGQSAVELSGDKKILIAGGVDNNNLSMGQALFNPARIWTDKDDYLPSDNVILSGSGWKANENIYLYAVDDTTEAWTYGTTVTAGANGGFVVDPLFVVQLVQLGANFHVTAVGAQSAMQADVKFTDANVGTVTVVPSPNATSGTVPPGGTGNYLVTVNFGGNNNGCSVTLSVSGLPAGATAGWNNTANPTVVVTGANNNTPQTATLQINTTGAIAPGTYNFNVNGALGGGGCTGSAPSPATGTLVVFGAATQLAFVQQPTNTAATASISPAVTVRVLDSGGRLVANSTASIGMAISTNPSGGTLSGTTPVNAVNGTATFSNLSIDKAGTGYRLQATSGALTSATSSLFNITVGAATQVRVETAADGSGTVVPAQNVSSGSSITVFSISRDAGGNFVDNVAAAWSLVNTTGGVVAGDLVPAGNMKSAVFTGHVAGTAAIHASSGALTSTDSGTLTVVGGTTASKLVFTTAPVTVTAGVASGTITVQRQDASGNPITTEAARTVTLSSNSTGTVTFTPPSPLTIPNGSSSVSFTYTDTKAGTPTITAASTSPTAITSATQNETVNAANASKLAFTTQPGNAAAGSAFGTQPVIKTQDTFGNNSTVGLAASSNVTVALTAGTGPLQGTTTLNIGTGAGNGTVSYTNLRIDVPGTDKQLTATSSTGLTSALSNVFTVNTGALDHFKVEAAPVPPGGLIGTQTAGTPFSIGITAQDAANNTVTSFSGTGAGGTVMLTSTGTLLGGPSIQTTAFSNGVLSSFSVTITNSGTFTITAAGFGGNAGKTGTSNSFTVNPGTVNTTTTVASSLNPSIYGDNVTFTANVAAASGTNNPTGTVIFTIDGSPVGPVSLGACSPPVAGTACASTSTSTLSHNGGSAHTVSAAYTATGNFVDSNGSLSPGQTVNKKTLTASIINDPTKPYDGNTDATLISSNFQLSGLVSPDDFTVTQTAGTYNSKDVATAATVTATLSASDFTPVGSTLADNYALPTTASGPGHISKVTLTASIIGDPTRPYNGNTTATLTSANFSLSPLAGTENFTVTQTVGTYNSKDVLAANMVTASLASGDFTPTGGADPGNYTLPTTASGAGHITPVTGLTASIIGNPTKPYNCNTVATLTSANFSLSGLVGTENFTVMQTVGAYNSKDVVAAISVSASLAAGDFTGTNGGIASNYVLPTSASGPGHITPADASISVTAYTSPTTVYNCLPHTASGTATGCDGNLNSLFDLSGTTHTDAGTYNGDPWTFNAGSANPNYNSASGTVNDSIAKANATINVTPYTSPTTVYNCNSHTATGTATGCDGNLLLLGDTLDLSGTTHTNAGDYPTDAWTFTDVTGNYNSTSGTVHDSIAKANTTASVSSTPNPSIVAQPVTFTATVAGNPAVTCVPTGTVTFKDGAATLGTGTLNASGQATFTTSLLSAGSHPITAVYGSDSNFNGSTGPSPAYVQSVQFIFIGFLPPIDNLPIVNSSKAGQTIPIKWQLKDFNGNLISDLGTLAPNGLTSGQVACGSAPQDVIEELSAPGGTVFRWDGTQFIYNWQTSKPWNGTCRLLQVKLSDGTSHYANFTFK